MTTEIEVETDESSDDSPDVVVVDTGDDGNTDEVVTETTIDHEGRLSAIETMLGGIVGKLEEIDSRLAMTDVKADVAMDEVQELEEDVTEVVADVIDATGSAEEVALIADAESATEELVEDVMDEAPVSKEHRWFRRFGA